jgi:hypothetical protein
MDDITSYLLGLPSDLNGSTAPNSTAVPLATPVNTSGGNTNTSGSFLSSLVSGLSGLGTTAAAAYSAFNKPTTTTPGAASASTTLTQFLPYLLIGGVVLVIVLLFRRK